MLGFSDYTHDLVNSTGNGAGQLQGAGEMGKRVFIIDLAQKVSTIVDPYTFV